MPITKRPGRSKRGEDGLTDLERKFGYAVPADFNATRALSRRRRAAQDQRQDGGGQWLPAAAEAVHPRHGQGAPRRPDG